MDDLERVVSANRKEREEEIRHAVILSVTTLCFPSMMRGRAWVEDVLARKEPEQNDG